MKKRKKKEVKDQFNKGIGSQKINKEYAKVVDSTERLVSQFSEDELKNVQFIIKSSFVHNRPNNAEELWQACKVLFNFEWPITSCSPENNPPFEWIYDTFFMRHTQTLTLASRGAGKTLGQAQTTFLSNLFHPRMTAITASAILKQSEVSQGYLRNFYQDDVLKTAFASAPSATQAKWKNESHWQIVTGSTKGVCLSYWTGVQTLEHGVLPIGHIVTRPNIYKEVHVKSYNWKLNKIEWKKVIGRHNHGKGGKFVQVNCENSSVSSLPKLTLNHEVYLSDGTKKLVSDLKQGDLLAFEGFKFSEAQEQVILGGLLGDASCSKEGRYTFAHGQSQIYYGDWKYNQFPSLQQSRKDLEGGFGTPCKYYRLQVTQFFKDLRRKAYPNGVKDVSYLLSKLNSKLGLAIWFMDDGSCSKNRWQLYTNGFSAKDHETLQEWFTTKWKVTPSIYTDKTGLNYLVFNVNDSSILDSLFQNYLTVENGKKLWIAENLVELGNTGIVSNTFKNVSEINLKEDRRFDLTVEGNHNFFLSNGMLVSNSGQHPVRLNLDEIEFWPIEAIEQTYAVPQDRDGYRKMWSGFSTRQRSFGGMAYMVDLATREDSAIKLYQWNIFETMQRCPTCLCIKGGEVVSDPMSKCFLWEDCVSYDQLVYTHNRGPVQIQDIKEGRDFVYSWSNGKLKINRVTKHWKVGEREVFEVQTNHRKSLKTTANHPFLVVKKEKLVSNRVKYCTEWVNMEDLKEGDLVVTSKKSPSVPDLTNVNGVKISDDLLQFIGMYIGDGTLEQYKVKIAEFAPTFVFFIQKFVEQTYGANSSLSKTEGVKIYSKKLVRDLNLLGLYKQYSHEKVFPSWVFNLSHRQKKALLKGYEISDGNYRVTPNKLITIYNSTSLELLKQVKVLLTTLGYTNIGSINKVRSVGEVLKIKGKAVTRKHTLYGLEVSKDGNKSLNYLYKNNPSLNNLLDVNDENFRLEKIIKKTYIGKEDVYDMTVENDHNFVVEGIVVHNCHGVKGLKSSGWFKREDAIELKKTMSKEAWETQYLCEKPSTHGLVLHNFEHSHATQSDINNGNYMAWEYQPDLPYFVSHDPAESKTSFIIFYQIWNGRMIVFDEIVDENCYTTETAKESLYNRIMERGYGFPEYVVVDPHRTDAGMQWRSGSSTGTGAGRSYPVRHPEMKMTELGKIEAGIELFKTYICNGANIRKFYINPDSCPKLVRCVKEHHYKIGKDNILLNDATPAPEGKDGVDTCRYALIMETQQNTMSLTSRSLSFEMF